jgi:hypothetical protein
MCWVKRCAHWSIVLSGLFLVLSIVAKVGPGAIAGASPRSLFALALIFAVYSIACSLCGAGSKSSGA